MTVGAGMSATMLASGIVAVLRAESVTACLPAIEVLAAAGISDIELTMTTPGLLDQLASVVAAMPGVTFGVGTVTSAGQARRAIVAGARFIVTPAVVPEVVEAALENGVPIYPGAMTPTEILSAVQLGATAVKLFPAAALGPGYIGHIHGPFPDVQLLPSGGISLDQVPAWIIAGAGAVSLGGPLLGDSLRGGSLSALASRAESALSAVRAGRARL